MSAMPESLKKRGEIIIELALARGVTLATVESCTAGSLAHLLSQADGASAALHGGFVVYTKANGTAPSALTFTCVSSLAERWPP